MITDVRSIWWFGPLVVLLLLTARLKPFTFDHRYLRHHDDVIHWQEGAASPTSGAKTNRSVIRR
jgi:hypothetical protein